LRGRFRTRVKCRRHSVASWDPSQTARSFGSLKLLGRANGSTDVSANGSIGWSYKHAAVPSSSECARAIPGWI
jgi:hypothetical protein